MVYRKIKAKYQSVLYIQNPYVPCIISTGDMFEKCKIHAGTNAASQIWNTAFAYDSVAVYDIFNHLHGVFLFPGKADAGGYPYFFSAWISSSCWNYAVLVFAGPHVMELPQNWQAFVSAFFHHEYIYCI